MKNKKLIFLLLSFSMIPICIVLGLFINSYVVRENYFFLEETGVYIKTKFAPRDELWSIYFSRNIENLISDNAGSIKLASKLGVQLVFHPSLDSVVYVVDNRRSIMVDSRNDVKIITVNNQDELFFQKQNVSRYVKTKEPYLMVNMAEYCDSTFLINYRGESIRAIPALLAAPQLGEE